MPPTVNLLYVMYYNLKTCLGPYIPLIEKRRKAVSN